MLELTSAGRPVYLNPNTSIQLESHSPLFDEDVVAGTFSYSIAVPAPPNGPLYGFPERPDADADPGAVLPAELAYLGVPLLAGTQRVKSATTAKYSVQLLAALSAASTALNERLIHTFSYGGLRQLPDKPAGSPDAVPGWVHHANDVARGVVQTDYVFAPVRVDMFYPDDIGSMPNQVPVVLNSWITYNAPFSGLPAGGSFTPFNNIVKYTPHGEDNPTIPFVDNSFASPFPRLGYVLRCIFEESGFGIDEARWLSGELADLVIMSPNRSLRVVYENDGMNTGAIHSSFHLADTLPAVTVAQLLAILRRALGLVVVVDPVSQRASITQLRELLADPHVLDVTELAAGAAEVELTDEPTALRLAYDYDPDDELTQDVEALQPVEAELSPPVATVLDLPATVATAEEQEQLRYVEDQDAYYRSAATGQMVGGQFGIKWNFFVERFAGQVVGTGRGSEEPEVYGQGFALTRMGRAPFRPDEPNQPLNLSPAPTPWLEVPHMSRAGYVPEAAVAKSYRSPAERPAALRLLFWRGMQPASDGSLYPLLTPLATNQAGQLVGGLSLRLSGPQGTYQQLLRAWLPVKLRPVLVKQQLRLSVLDVARLRLDEKVRLDGVEYLVRKLAVTLPLRKPASVELVRVVRP